jgi:hypothetical protein
MNLMRMLPTNDNNVPRMARAVMSPDVNIDPTRIPWLSDFDSTKYAIYPGMRAKEQG